VQGIKRKIVFVTFYELIAIACITAGLASVSDQPVSHSSVAAVVNSAFAIAWNLVYNTLFEAWEARQPTRGRSLMRRIAHTVGFESGFLIVGVPFFAWWLDISMVQAFMLNVGFIVFFLAYSFCYNWAFDAVFGLPTSAQAKTGAEAA